MDKLKELESIANNYKHLISDFDGTLVILNVDWNSVLEKTISYFKEKLNLSIDLDTYWELTYKFSTLYLKHKQQLDNILREEENKVIENNAWEKINSKLWDLLSKKDFSILSNNLSTTVEEIMLKESLVPSMIIGRDRVSLPKPDVEGINLIIRSFKLKKEEVLFIGDTKWDELTAKKAEVAYFGVSDRDV